MPNHVYNTVTVTGKKQAISRFKRHFKQKNSETIIDFETIIPMPEKVFRGDLGNKEKEIHGENNWYDWSRKHWGTKWNAYDQEIDDETDTSITFKFCTAWGFPEPVIKKLVKLNKTLEFDGQAHEESDAFNLEWSGKAGIMKVWDHD